MRCRNHILAVLAVTALALVMSACAEHDPDAEQAASDATAPWLQRMDAGAYADCWEAAAPLLRERVTREEWGQRATEARSPLGGLRERALETTTFVTNPWGAPEGRYVIVVYASSWEAGDIHETVSMQEQPDGAWLVAGYHVKQRVSGS